MLKHPTQTTSVRLNAEVIGPLLLTKGFFIADNIVSISLCRQLSQDLVDYFSRGLSVIKDENNLVTNGLLQHSEALRRTLDHSELGTLVSTAFNEDAILNRVEAIVEANFEQDSWKVDFLRPLRDLDFRAFRPGINIYFPLKEKGGTIEVIQSSQYVKLLPDLSDNILKQVTIKVPPGSVIILEAGIRHRFLPTSMPWLNLSFLHPWMKPEVLFATALRADYIDDLGLQGKQWCGMQIGLPTTIEEFLLIEEEALEGKRGRVKGSGI